MSTLPVHQWPSQYNNAEPEFEPFLSAVVDCRSESISPYCSQPPFGASPADTPQMRAQSLPKSRGSRTRTHDSGSQRSLPSTLLLLPLEAQAVCFEKPRGKGGIPRGAEKKGGQDRGVKGRGWGADNCNQIFFLVRSPWNYG